MKKYKINVTRTSTVRITKTIMANNDREAINMAIDAYSSHKLVPVNETTIKVKG